MRIIFLKIKGYIVEINSIFAPKAYTITLEGFRENSDIRVVTRLPEILQEF
jgi:hypothetical protein